MHPAHWSGVFIWANKKGDPFGPPLNCIEMFCLLELLPFSVCIHRRITI